MRADWGDHQRGFEKGGAGSCHSFQSPTEREGVRRPAPPPPPTHTHNVSRTAQPDGALVPRKINLSAAALLFTSPASQMNLNRSTNPFFCCLPN